MDTPTITKTQHSRNSEALQSFVDYCKANPNERFWQALRNWSGEAFILVGSGPWRAGFKDTFHREGKNE